MNFSFFQQIFLVPINAIGLMLAWWVVKSNSTRAMKRWFVLMTVFMLLWVNFAYFGLNANKSKEALVWYRLNYAAVSLFLPSFFYFYVVHFLKRHKWVESLSKIVLVVAILFFIISILSDYVVSGIIVREWGMEIEFGPLGLFFNLFAAVVAVLVVYFSVAEYASSSHDIKRKLRYFLSGVLIFIFANLTFNVGSQVFFQSVKYQIFGDFSAIFLLCFTAYAIIRYELFDIKVVATEALTIIMWVILFSKLFVSQSKEQYIVDLSVFVLTVVFGIMLIRSVTREVQQRKKLEELNNKLKELDKQKDEFVSMAAHELRSPMTAIKGYLSMVMEGDTGDIPEKARGFLADANAINDRLVRLVNNMLNVSRIEEGRLVYQIEDVNLSQVVNTAFAQFRPEAERKGLKFTVEIPQDLRDLVTVDPDRIQEVVGNMVSNAIKYTNEGLVTIRLSQPSPSIVRVEIIDTGPGISKEEITKLFRKFYRAESSVGKTVGTGLGLYMSKLLVEKFGGKIGVESEVGKGSNFWFELPLKKGSATTSTLRPGDNEDKAD